MRFQVNNLLVFYMILLGCMFLFNIYYVLWRRFENFDLEYEIKKWRTYLLGLLEDEAGDGFGTQIMKLKKSSRMEAFNLAVDRMEDEKRCKILNIIWEHRKEFNVLINEYRQKPAVYKAYMAYFIGKYALLDENPPAVRYILETVLEPSIYCRENGLQALYRDGSPGAVIKAFELFSKEQIQHNNKLVTDGLLLYRGNVDELAEQIWEQWDEFLDYYKVAFIDFFRMAGCEYGERILSLLKDGTQDRDVRFACIRYFRKIKYEPAAEILRTIVRNWTAVDWEFPAVAALSLSNFPGEETREVLVDGLCSSNWYIRYNCAETLDTFEDAEKTWDKVRNGNDRYAKEIFAYRREASIKARQRAAELEKGEAK